MNTPPPPPINANYGPGQTEQMIPIGCFYALRRIIRLDVLDVWYLIRQA